VRLDEQGEGLVEKPGKDRPGIAVPARFIPVPTGISPEARAFFSHVPPLGNARRQPALDDKAGWRAQAEAADQAIIAISAMYAEHYPAETRAHELSSAPVYELVSQSLVFRMGRRGALYFRWKTAVHCFSLVCGQSCWN